MFSGYSYARLAAKYPSDTGVVAFFDTAFPSRAAAGSLSLIYLMTLAVSSALISKSFGAYAARLALGVLLVAGTASFQASRLGSSHGVGFFRFWRRLGLRSSPILVTVPWRMHPERCRSRR